MAKSIEMAKYNYGENTEHFFKNLSFSLLQDVSAKYKNTEIKVVDADEELYDKFLVLKLNEDVSPQKLDDLLSEVISKATNYSREKGFLDCLNNTYIAVTR